MWHDVRGGSHVLRRPDSHQQPAALRSFLATTPIAIQCISAAGQARLPVELSIRNQAALHACTQPASLPAASDQAARHVPVTSKHVCPGKCSTIAFFQRMGWRARRTGAPDARALRLARRAQRGVARAAGRAGRGVVARHGRHARAVVQRARARAGCGRPQAHDVRVARAALPARRPVLRLGPVRGEHRSTPRPASMGRVDFCWRSSAGELSALRGGAACRMAPML